MPSAAVSPCEVRTHVREKNGMRQVEGGGIAAAARKKVPVRRVREMLCNALTLMSSSSSSSSESIIFRRHVDYYAAAAAKGSILEPSAL